MARLAVFAAVAATAYGAPCDIYGATGTPCVAAHSMVRALYSSFSGALYQVRRKSDNSTLDIPVLTPGGAANATAQDTFCMGTDCVVMRIYDQSPRANHLDVGPGGGAAPKADLPVNATRHRVTAGGKPVYAAFFEGKQGYRNDKTMGIAVADEPETLYMVTSGAHVNGGCCFDYGNAEVDNHDDRAGTMEAVYFGTSKDWGHGAGNGPWVMADLEDGLWAGNLKVNPSNTPLAYNFVTAVVKGDTNNHFALKGGDATRGKLTTMYDGVRPAGYEVMKKQGAIILGIGGDNSNSALGTFYEGLMTTGYSTDAADDAVQADIVAFGYAL